MKKTIKTIVGRLLVLHLLLTPLVMEAGDKYILDDDEVGFSESSDGPGAFIMVIVIIIIIVIINANSSNKADKN